MKDYKNVNEDIRIKIKNIKLIRTFDIERAKKLEDSLILSLDYLVHSVIYKYKRFDNYEDLYQEGMFGLIKAVQHYNSDMSFHFVRYAIWWVKARVMRSIKKLSIISSNDKSFIKFFTQYDIDDETMIGKSDPENDAILSEQFKHLNESINLLPKKYQYIISLRYGLNNNKEHNLQELSNKLNMTREGIRQLEHRILNKLKHNVISEREFDGRKE